MARKASRKIGARVRQLRAKAGLTQLSLALAAEIAPETLSRIERDRFAPSPLVLTRLAQALGAPVASLFETIEEPETPALRPCEVRLLNLVRELDDKQVDRVVEALTLLLAERT